MKKLVLGFIIGFISPLLIAYLFVIGGGMPMGTKAPPLPMERLLARKALHAAFKGDLDKKAPFAADEAHLVAGARIYRDQCMVCHGISQRPATLISQGMFPPPPQLFEPEKDVTDDPVGEVYWKIKNGIRLTGMPGFAGGLSEQELWETTLFLNNANTLSENIKKLFK